MGIETRQPVDCQAFADLLGSDPLPTKPALPFPGSEIGLDRSRLLTEAQLADEWGVSTRQVRKLVSEACIEKVESRYFDRAECTRRYIRRLVEQANQRSATRDPNLQAEKLRLTREQADAVELKNQIARAELVPAASVVSEWADILRTVRAGMLSVPSRLNSRLSLSAYELGEIDREIRDTLTSLGQSQNVPNHNGQESTHGN